MASPLPSDPYIALGVPRDATPAAIKLAYRKLVLKFHPDKVQDVTQKQAASDQFHKIQTAYEIVGDEDRRARYEAQCRLAELKRDVMEKQNSYGARTDVRPAGSRMRTESPGRATFSSRAPERAERVHVEERRPYDTGYFDMPRSTARKDYDYERSKRAVPREEKERPRATRQDTKENERARQKEKVKQSTRDTRRDRDYKYSSYPEPQFANPSDSDSDSPTERARRQRREEDVQRKARSPYYDQVKRPRDEPMQGLYPEDSTKKMSSAEYSARDYIERSRGSSRQYQEAERRPSASRVPASSKVEYIKRGEGRPAVMVRRGSGKPRTSGREAEESPRHSTRDRQRPRRSSDEFEEMPRRPPPLSQTKSAPEGIKLPEPRRAYSLQTDFDNKEEFQAPPFRRADSMPQQSSRREEPRGSRKQSTLRKTEISEGLPTPGATPVDGNPKYRYGEEYADDNEYATPNGYRTEVREPLSSRRVARSPSPVKEERAREDRSRAAPSRYPSTATSPRPGLSPNTRTTSYVYTPQGVEPMPVRPTLSRNNSSKKESLYGEVPVLSRPSLPKKESGRTTNLYGEIPTTRSPRQTRSKWSPPPEEVRYGPKRDDVKYQTGYSSRRPTEVKPSYGRTNSYSQAAY